MKARLFTLLAATHIGVAVVVAVLAWTAAPVAALLFGLAIALVAAAVTARMIGDPLKRLAFDVSRIGTGLGTRVAERGPAEVRAIAHALQMLADTLVTRVDELRRESGLREQILSAMSEGVMLAEPNGSIVYANPAATTLLGPAAALPPHVALQGPADLTVHHPRRRELRIARVGLADGRRLVVVQDVTEAKRVEAMRRDFVADASHEMKTPVAALLATAETLDLALRDDVDAARAMSRTLVAEARRLSRLVQDLLDLARLEQARAPDDEVSLSEIVAQEAALGAEQAKDKGLGFFSDLDDDIVVRGSEPELALATRNLIDNAIRYTASGDVRVRLSLRDAHAVIEVADTGIGIPARDLPRVFERFYRVDRARARETGGTGLGLSIVRHVADRHGGDVSAASEFGRGTTIRLRVPVSRDPSA